MLAKYWNQGKWIHAKVCFFAVVFFPNTPFINVIPQNVTNFTSLLAHYHFSRLLSHLLFSEEKISRNLPSFTAEKMAVFYRLKLCFKKKSTVIKQTLRCVSIFPYYNFFPDAYYESL